MKSFRGTTALFAALLLFQQARAGLPPSAGTNLAPPALVLKSPVDFFRELLALTPAERKEKLAGKADESQRRIAAKLREYESLKPDQRELRLRATELHWFLLPLMKSPATNRAERLAAIPEETRRLVGERLQQWDALAPAVQMELLENEHAVRLIAQPDAGTNASKPAAEISAARRVKLEAGIERWQSLPETKRAEITKRFGQFFDLTPKEKEKALRTLSDAERQQMEKTLRSFEKLPRDQRVQCVRAFEKFAGMSLDERQQFLKNAERWRAMSPGERQSWRDLVGKVPQWPPMPPGFGVPAGKLPAPPPLPPGISVPMATNRG